MEDKTKGIVIGSIDYKEKSKIVYLYTPNGKEVYTTNVLLDKEGLTVKNGSINILNNTDKGKVNC